MNVESKRVFGLSRLRWTKCPSLYFLTCCNFHCTPSYGSVIFYAFSNLWPDSSAREFLFFFLMTRRPPRSPLFPSPPLFRSKTHRGAPLDSAEPDEFRVHHYASLVGDDEFDAPLGRIPQPGTPSWAAPFHGVPNEINRLYE